MTSEVLELIFRAKDMASGAVSGLRGGMQDLTNTQKTYQTSLESLSGPANQFKNIIMQLGAAVGVAGLARSFIEINSSAEKTKLMLEGLTGSSEKANEAFQWILDFSTKAPFSINALKDSFVKLQVAGLDPMSGSLQTLTDALAAFGGSDQDLEQAAVAIQQMAGKGVISMEELRQQLGEKLPTAMKAMADGMGMSMAQLSKAIESGSVSASVGLSAMMSKLEEMYGGRGQSMMMSWTGLISNVKVAWEKFMLKLGETGIFDKLKSTIDGVLKKIDEMTANGELAVWGERISTTVKALIDLFLKLAGVFITVVDALGPFLPMIITTVAYFKTLQFAILGPLSSLALMIARIFALKDAFALFQTTSIFNWFQRLSYMIYMNVEAGTALGLVMKASFIGIAIAIGYALGTLVNYVLETKKLNDLNKETADNVKYIKERLDTYNAALTDVNTKISELNKAYKEGSVSSKEYSDKIHELSLAKRQLEVASNESASALTHFSGAIKNIDKEMKSAVAAYESGSMSAAEYQAKIESLTEKKDKLWAKMSELKKGLKDIDTQMIALTASFKAGEISEETYTEGINKLTASKKQLIATTDNLTESTAKQKKTYEDFISGIEKGSAEWITIEEKRIATLEAQHAEEKALLDKALAEKTISQADYYARIEEMDAEFLEKKKALIEAQIALEKSKGGEADFAKIAELEEKKTQLVLKGSTDRIKLETDAIKETIKKHEDGFSKWKELKELELQSLKASLDLQAAMDEAAAAQGIISQSELLRRKQAQATEYYEKQIRDADEAAARIAETEGLGSKAYAEAIAKKIKLEDDHKVSAIQSAEAIRAAQENEQTAALKRHAEILEDKILLIKLERDRQLAISEQQYDQGLISYEEFQAQVVAINAKANAAIAEAQQNALDMQQAAMLDYVAAFFGYLDDLTNRVREAFLSEDILGQMTATFKNGQDIILQNAKSMMYEMSEFTKKSSSNFIQWFNGVSYDMLGKLYLYGRDVTNLSREEIGIWVDNVTDYVQRVQDLFASLQDTISNYQDQLDQMRGNDSAILDRWYQEQIAKLEEKYGADLKNTEAYQEALTLIEQLYAEKRRKIAEKERKDKSDAYTYAFPDPAQGIKDKLNSGTSSAVIDTAVPGRILQKIESSVLATVELKGDVQSAERYVKEFLMPAIKRQLALEGIVLKPA